MFKLLAAIIAVFVIAGVAQAALPGKRVGKAGTATGEVAIATAQATVLKPKAIYGHAVGKIDTVTFIYSCSRGFNVAAKSLDRSRAGLWRLPIMLRADRCMVTGSAGGSGRILVEIRAVR